MALEASAELSIFPWPAPGNLHLVNWGYVAAACAAMTEISACHSEACLSKLTETLSPVQALCFS